MTEETPRNSAGVNIEDVGGAADGAAGIPVFDCTGDILARGGFGECYISQNESTGKAVVKVPKPYCKDPEDMVRAEALMLSALYHYNITSGGLAYAVTRGGKKKLAVWTELFGRSAEACMPLAPEQVKDIAGGVCCALAYMHGAGLVHFDVKPANILICIFDEFVDVKLADLGLALPVEAADFHKRGTYGFMAPELRTYRKTARGFPVDIWSLGASLYYMLSGGSLPRFAIGADGRMSDRLEDAHAIGGSAMGLIELCLQSDPALRPTAEECTTHPYFDSSTDANAAGQNNI